MPASQQSIAELPSGIQRNGRRSAATNVFRSLWDDRLGAAGVAILLIVLIISIAPGAFAPYSPHTIDLDNAFSPPSYLQGGVAGHPLGTDHLGRDLFSRILYSARVSLLVAIAAVAVSAVFGILMGLLAGYVGSWLDNLIMGVTEMQAALPVILLALAIVAVLGPGVLNLVLVLSLTGWVIYRAYGPRDDTVTTREGVYQRRSLYWLQLAADHAAAHAATNDRAAHCRGHLGGRPHDDPGICTEFPGPGRATT